MVLDSPYTANSENGDNQSIPSSVTLEFKDFSRTTVHILKNTPVHR